MPNGTPDVSGAPIPIPDEEFFEDPLSFGILGDIARGIGSFFGFGGGTDPRPVQTPAERDARLAEFARQKAREPVFFTQAGPFPITSPFSGRLSIPTPEQGGPELVTQRFQELPGPFVEPGLGIMPFELRAIPEPDILPFEPTPIPEPDVLEDDMAIDAPLLAGFGTLLPAVRQAAPTTIGALTGGFLQEAVQGLFSRAPQEMGLGQVPALPSRRPAAMPGEKPSTRILRMIKNNTGVSVKLSRAKSLIRELGLQNAARCLGITINEACALLIAASPRRRRGISASDIRIVKRTSRRFESLKHALSHIGGRGHPHVHRRRRHHHAHSHK